MRRMWKVRRMWGGDDGRDDGGEKAKDAEAMGCAICGAPVVMVAWGVCRAHVLLLLLAIEVWRGDVTDWVGGTPRHHAVMMRVSLARRGPTWREQLRPLLE